MLGFGMLAYVLFHRNFHLIRRSESFSGQRGMRPTGRLGIRMGSIWSLRQLHKITPDEMKLLSQGAKIGSLSSRFSTYPETLNSPAKSMCDLPLGRKSDRSNDTHIARF